MRSAPLFLLIACLMIASLQGAEQIRLSIVPPSKREIPAPVSVSGNPSFYVVAENTGQTSVNILEDDSSASDGCLSFVIELSNHKTMRIECLSTFTARAPASAYVLSPGEYFVWQVRLSQGWHNLKAIDLPQKIKITAQYKCDRPDLSNLALYPNLIVSEPLEIMLKK